MCAYEFDYYTLITKQHAVSFAFFQSSYIDLHKKPFTKLSDSNLELINLFVWLLKPSRQSCFASSCWAWRIICCNNFKMLFLAKVESYCTPAFSVLSVVDVIDRMLLIVSKK